MNTLYSMLFEIKTDLKENQSIKVELTGDMGSIIRKHDKISCFDGILVIIRKDHECLIPMEQVKRIRRVNNAAL